MSSTAVAAEATQPSAEVEVLTHETRQEIVKLREDGLTLSELKERYPQLSGEQIRDLLPPQTHASARRARPSSRGPPRPAASRAPARRPPRTPGRWVGSPTRRSRRSRRSPNRSRLAIWK